MRGRPLPEKAYDPNDPSRQRRYYQANLAVRRAYARDYQWRKRLAQLGLREEDYIRLLAEQNGRCLICGKKPKVKKKVDPTRRALTERLAMDHNHVTGKFRGFICTNCNAGLGHFNDDPRLLRAAAVYLERS